MTRDQEISVVKGAIDGLSIANLGAWALGFLPAVATLLTIIWTILRIIETRPVQKWLGNEVTPPNPSPSPFDSTE